MWHAQYPTISVRGQPSRPPTPTATPRASHEITAIRVRLPQHLRRLAREVHVDVDDAQPVTLAAVLDALEARHPVLCGAVRDHDTHRRRPFVRFFACRDDLSHLPPDDPLPDEVASRREPLEIVGAMAGG